MRLAWKLTYQHSNHFQIFVIRTTTATIKASSTHNMSINLVLFAAIIGPYIYVLYLFSKIPPRPGTTSVANTAQTQRLEPYRLTGPTRNLLRRYCSDTNPPHLSLQIFRRHPQPHQLHQRLLGPDGLNGIKQGQSARVIQRTIERAWGRFSPGSDSASEFMRTPV
jgi:hypothetical protein